MPGRLDDRVRERVAPYLPLLLRALDAAVAAAVAWALVQPVGGLADRYPYYAPLGAVVAVSTTILGSARGAVATVRNLALGAALGTAAQLLGLPELLALALVVGLGTVLSGSRLLASGSSWIVYSAVFVLILGGEAPWEYGLAYAGLTCFGALVGIVVVAALPPLLITPGAQAVAEAGATLADQLEDLADALADESGPPSERQWSRRQRDLRPTMQRLDDTVHAVLEARRGNWRARWWRASTSAQQERAALVRRSHPLVEQLVLLLVREERADLPRVALGPSLRPSAAAALRGWGRLLRSASQDLAVEAPADELREAVADLQDAVRRSAGGAAGPGTSHLEASTVVTTVRLGLDLVEESLSATRGCHPVPS
ncbi:hypothetical protein [Nocardioides marmoraquaticus]